MSKSDKKFQEWAETFKANLPENLRDSWTAIVKNDYAKKDELVGKFLMQEDYTRKAQALAEERAAMEAKTAAYDSWYQQEAPKVERANAELQRIAALETALKSTGFNQDSKAQPVTPTQEGLLKEINDLKAFVQRVDQGSVAAATQLPQLAYQAFKDGYSFDSQKIVEIASRNNMPLNSAYNEFIKEERLAREKADFQKQLDQAREEGRKEAFSKVTPDSQSGLAVTPVLDRLFSATPKRDDAGNPTTVATKSNMDLINRAIQTFHSSEGQSSPF